MLIGIVVGAAYSITSPIRGAYVDNLMSAGAIGVPLWAIVSVITLPLVSGHTPEWSAEQMRQHFPALVGVGALRGHNRPANTSVACLGREILGPEPIPKPLSTGPKQIVILGGGFAGMTTAQNLEDVFGPNRSVALTLVSDTNALLFTPMLAEVAGSSLEPSHISTPLRTSLQRTQVVRGRVTEVNLGERRVGIAVEGGGQRGSWSTIMWCLRWARCRTISGLRMSQQLAFDFKSLLDAIKIRNHVIDMFEHADRELDRELRREMLTFVIAGGGFAGVELAGALNDFARGILADYPNISTEELQIVLVHSRDRILPELSESLGRYAL